MKNEKMFARFVLLAAAVIWGSSFAVLKNTLDTMPILFILSFRFLVGGVLLSAVFLKKLSKLNGETVKKGGIIGICLFLAYYIQTLGLADTTPGKNAFLTATYCVIVPFLFWITDKKRPDKYNIAAAVICLTGIGFVSLNKEMVIQTGDYITLISSFFLAAHIVLIAKFAKDCDPVLLTIIQFFTCGLIAAVGSFFGETVPTEWFHTAWKELLYMAVFCTAITLLCQNWGQSKLPPSNASVLMTLESVFGVIFSIVLYGERITPKLLAGFCLIFAATIISETKLSFLKKNSENKEVSK